MNLLRQFRDQLLVLFVLIADEFQLPRLNVEDLLTLFRCSHSLKDGFCFSLDFNENRHRQSWKDRLEQVCARLIQSQDQLCIKMHQCQVYRGSSLRLRLNAEDVTRKIIQIYSTVEMKNFLTNVSGQAVAILNCAQLESDEWISRRVNLLSSSLKNVDVEMIPFSLTEQGIGQFWSIELQPLDEEKIEGKETFSLTLNGQEKAFLFNQQNLVISLNNDFVIRLVKSLMDLPLNHRETIHAVISQRQSVRVRKALILANRLRPNLLIKFDLIEVGNVKCSSSYDQYTRSLSQQLNASECGPLVQSCVTAALLCSRSNCDVDIDKVGYKQILFAQYNCGRIHQLLAKHEQEYSQPCAVDEEINFHHLDGEVEQKVVFQLLLLQQQLDSIHLGNNFSCRLFASLNHLVRAFSVFYNKSKILVELTPTTLSVIKAKIALVKAVEKAFAGCFELLELREVDWL